mmetsp:Transcript_52552/g.163089  ORF Transcript_52552/g.163089 Transcript_52552/m.163089 type:complete len:210 (+) Transcript_52552:967-1596(+)
MEEGMVRDESLKQLWHRDGRRESATRNTSTCLAGTRPGAAGPTWCCENTTRSWRESGACGTASSWKRWSWRRKRACADLSRGGIAASCSTCATSLPSLSSSPLMRPHSDADGPCNPLPRLTPGSRSAWLVRLAAVSSPSSTAASPTRPRLRVASRSLSPSPCGGRRRWEHGSSTAARVRRAGGWRGSTGRGTKGGTSSPAASLPASSAR